MRGLIQEFKSNPVPFLAIIFILLYFGMHITLWLAGITPEQIGLR